MSDYELRQNISNRDPNFKYFSGRSLTGPLTGFAAAAKTPLKATIPDPELFSGAELFASSSAGKERATVSPIKQFDSPGRQASPLKSASKTTPNRSVRLNTFEDNDEGPYLFADQALNKEITENNNNLIKLHAMISNIAQSQEITAETLTELKSKYVQEDPQQNTLLNLASSMRNSKELFNIINGWKGPTSELLENADFKRSLNRSEGEKTEIMKQLIEKMRIESYERMQKRQLIYDDRSDEKKINHKFAKVDSDLSVAKALIYNGGPQQRIANAHAVIGDEESIKSTAMERIATLIKANQDVRRGVRGGIGIEREFDNMPDQSSNFYDEKAYYD